MIPGSASSICRERFCLDSGGNFNEYFILELSRYFKSQLRIDAHYGEKFILDTLRLWGY